MTVQKALLVELFAILYVLWVGIGLIEGQTWTSETGFHLGFVIGVLGLCYGLADGVLHS
ncbi:MULTISPECIES: hypothetical protein [Halorussus]|uniref:hypothetical protein n=1 Tax=Halorussus TaxID=1070314 RepID=UPI00209ED7A7|nr:hypothetical protein [Halorussus vallis]USZ77775.1 hypothetical protein NGM07_21575 [Halorussus vallis]